MMDCDMGTIRKDAASRGYDEVMIVSDSVGRIRASYGGISKLSTHSHSGTCQHEYLHALGFADEYYCPRLYSSWNRPNLAYIKPLNPYDNDQVARGKHQDAIPWYKHIQDSTPIITSDLLGSPSHLEDKIGLFSYEIKTSK